MVQGKTFKDQQGRYYSEPDIDFTCNKLESKTGIPLDFKYEKMSKSKGNGVDPNVSVAKH